jgi:hypothetical protein
MAVTPSINHIIIPPSYLKKNIYRYFILKSGLFVE